MHIGFITPEYPCNEFTGNIGGIGTFTKNLASQLINNGHQVSVFIHSQSKSTVIEHNGIKIHFVKKVTVKSITWLTNRFFFNKYVNNSITSEKIDFLEAPEWTGFTAFMRFNCPLVLRLHGSDTYFCNLDNRPVKWKNKFFEKKALLGADKIIGVSEFVSKKTIELFHLKKEIETIHNTIDANQFKPNHTQIKPKTLLYFGSIIRKKGVLEIPEVFNQLIVKDPNITLTLLGRDVVDVLSGESTLKLFTSKLSKHAVQNIKYIPSVPYHEVKRYIQQAEVVLLPSFAEAFPMTWLEAMALEKKLVTSNIGWANELMIDGETGYTVSPKNHENFANNILTLLNDDEKSTQMSKKARIHIIEFFNAEISLAKNLKMYKSMIKS